MSKGEPAQPGNAGADLDTQVDTPSEVLAEPGSKPRNRRPKRRQLFCPAHPQQTIEGNGRK